MEIRIYSILGRLILQDMILGSIDLWVYRSFLDHYMKIWSQIDLSTQQLFVVWVEESVPTLEFSYSSCKSANIRHKEQEAVGQW